MIRALHCREGVHDKVYIVVVRPSGSGYIAEAYWGRRGASLQRQVLFNGSKADCESAANAKYDKKRHAGNKGYEDIASNSYIGPVSMALVRQWLASAGCRMDDGVEGRPAVAPASPPISPPPPSDEFEVVRLTLSEAFDKDIRYLARWDKGAIVVWDKFGQAVAFKSEIFDLHFRAAIAEEVSA